MGRIVLILFAVGWAAFGVSCLVSPVAMLNPFNIQLLNPESLAEIRAMYGGAQIGLAAFFLYASLSQALVKPGLLLAALIMGGFALGRLTGIVIDGSFQLVTLGSLVIEVAICCLALVALRRHAAADTRSAA
jgi:hypothetical protein